MTKPFTEINYNDQNSPRWRRCIRFADTIQKLCEDFLPHDRHVARVIREKLMEIGWEYNFELIEVPPEKDALDAQQLAQEMITNHPVFIKSENPFGEITS